MVGTESQQRTLHAAGECKDVDEDLDVDAEEHLDADLDVDEDLDEDLDVDLDEDLDEDLDVHLDENADVSARDGRDSRAGGEMEMSVTLAFVEACSRIVTISRVCYRIYCIYRLSLLHNQCWILDQWRILLNA